MDNEQKPIELIAQATTSRETDEAVLDKIFGHDFEYVEDIPPFSSDWFYAMQVRDEVLKWGFANRHHFIRRVQELVTSEFPDAFRDPTLVIHMDEVIMRMQPRHICMAALEIAAGIANGVDYWDHKGAIMPPEKPKGKTE